jgi:16S rRNA (cytosine1407-C5)-methyltransferase
VQKKDAKMPHHIPPELDAFLDELIGNDRREIYQQIGEKLPHHIRFNPLKGTIADQIVFFREQGFDFEPLETRDGIFRITCQPYPIGKSVSHFLGHIYVQDFASMIPALALDAQPGDWVLDMSAAPGSKTTLLAALMNNRGVILANDSASKRLKALGTNLERMSVCNTLVYKWFGEQFGNVYFETFDRVLLDPACSGLGTLHKNPEILTWWTEKHCERLADSQRNLIISAIKTLRPGGTLVYSTCTLAPIENEAVVNFALENFPVELEEIQIVGLQTWPGLRGFRGETFSPGMEKTIRLYPFGRVTEGFFVAKLRKTASVKAPPPEKRKKARQTNYLSHKTSPVKKYLDFLSEYFEIPREVFSDYVYLMQNEIVFVDRGSAEFPLYGAPLQIGLPLARAMDRGAKLNTGGCHIFGQRAQSRIVEIADLQTLEKYLNRKPLEITVEKPGQYIVKYKNNILGYGVADDGRLKSQFPRGDWPFEVNINGI